MWSAGRIAATAASLTTRAAIGIAQSARACPREGGGRGGGGLARGSPSRFSAGRVFPRGLHPADRDRSAPLPEQGGHLPPALPPGGRDAAHEPRPPPAPLGAPLRHPSSS